MEKSRREKRKEARSEKTAQKHQLWLQRQENKKNFQKLKSKSLGESNDLLVSSVKTSQDSGFDSEFCKEETLEGSKMEEDVEPELESPRDSDLDSPKVVKRKKGTKRNAKTSFEKFLEMDKQNAAVLAKEDLELERRLAKKLKVKSGKLRGEDDGINVLFEGLSSAMDSAGEDELPVKKLGKSTRKKRKMEELPDDALEVETPGESMVEISDTTEMDGSEEAFEEVTAKVPSRKGKNKSKLSDEGQENNILDDANIELSKLKDLGRVDVQLEEVPSQAPQKYVAPHLRTRGGGSELEEYSQIRRRVRGLLNKLSESNVESIAGEMSVIFRSVPRIISSQIISEEVLASCSGGPRGNEQYASVFAAFVAGMACSVGVDFSAKLLASLAKNFEDEYHKQDNLSLRNLTLLFSYLYIFGVCSSDLVYDFITMLGQRLTEVDVSTILTVLQCCGMKIRADDPLSMKNFIASVQSRVNELKASSGEGQGNINSKRMEFMLETICDIKNNKKRPKEDSSHHTRIKKWLQKLRVEEIIIRGIKWSKLLDPNKKGQWWSAVDTTARDDVEEVANTIDKEVLEAQKMLQLAAAQRMNTDARKAIFCIIMSSEDYIDAFEKLLRLDLPGKQDREIMRVLLDCCLQEKVFNKYYTVLASKLCEHEKNHKFTLQFCLWDHFKEVESMPLIRSMNLARFVAEMVISFTLSVAVLKAVDLNDIRQLTPKRVMHFRMLFEAMFEYPDKVIWNVFTRVALTPELESLRQGIEFFVKEYLVKSNRKMSEKLKVVKKALNNAEGILM